MRTKVCSRPSPDAFQFQSRHGPRGRDTVTGHSGDAGDSTGSADNHKHGIIHISQPLHEWLIEDLLLQCRILFFFLSLIHA